MVSHYAFTSQIDLTPTTEDSKNLEKENSELRKALEKCEYDKKENWKLACHGANILADITEKMHRFKEQSESDTLAWHKNYRKQLADEREENLNLRNQINDMKAAACRANEHLRQMRRFVTDHDEWHELRVQNVALRQEKRFWKRLALPLLLDDDSEFSDDDDLIDPEVRDVVNR
jgi:hydroxylamine reductase (hybrid-cluster protein)